MSSKRLSASAAVVAALLGLFARDVTPARAEEMGFGAGVTNKTPEACAQDAMNALVASGFNQNVATLNAQLPHRGVFGSRPEGQMAMIICARRGDVIVVLSGPNNVEKLKQDLAAKMTQLLDGK